MSTSFESTISLVLERLKGYRFWWGQSLQGWLDIQQWWDKHLNVCITWSQFWSSDPSSCWCGQFFTWNDKQSHCAINVCTSSCSASVVFSSQMLSWSSLFGDWLPFSVLCVEVDIGDEILTRFRSLELLNVPLRGWIWKKYRSICCLRWLDNIFVVLEIRTSTQVVTSFNEI